MNKRGRYAIYIDIPEEQIKKPPMITVRLSVEQFNNVVFLSRTLKKSLNAICLEALDEYYKTNQPK